jgi:hypothetical protein
MLYFAYGSNMNWQQMKEKRLGLRQGDNPRASLITFYNPNNRSAIEKCEGSA